MTLTEAIALQPAWVNYWVTWLLVGAYILPLSLLIWRQTRIAAIVTLTTSILAAMVMEWLYAQVGFVKLLGLPHVIFWTPTAIFLAWQLKHKDLSKWPRNIMAIVLLTITISLAFDYLDVARYILGERQTLV
jgi:lysylphosphatidylglycerol synthetase-like protein (DUF2156 family)